MTTKEVTATADSRKVTKSWREVLPIHPAAAAYPRLSTDELAQLAADIKARGLQVPIVTIWEDGKEMLVDGISRLDAIELAGFTLVKNGSLDDTLGLGGGCQRNYGHSDDPYVLAASLNAHRRHLSPEQKRERIEALLKAAPEKSDRQIAKEAKTNHKIVGRTRKRLESTGTVSQLTTRTGADGKSRKQPATASKPVKAVATDPDYEASADPNARRKSASADAEERWQNSLANSCGEIITRAAVAFTSIAAKVIHGEAKTATLGRPVLDEAAKEGPSNAGLDRLQARNEQLENENRMLQSRIIGLESEIAEVEKARKSLPAALQDAYAMAQQVDLWPALNEDQTAERDKLIVALRDLAALARTVEGDVPLFLDRTATATKH